jgi:23S rRNA pseudouridine1911/1915/1917 synthase
VQPDSSGDPSLVDLVAEHRRRREHKPGNVFVGLLHRLDRPVSGVVLIAKTSKAASRISEQFRSRTVRKRYFALCHLAPDSPRESAGIWTDEVIKERRTNVVRARPGLSATDASTADPSTDDADFAGGTEPGARIAETRWTIVARAPAAGLVAVILEPVTGRSHQLRVQAASHGLVIVGDVKYGSPIRARGRIKLHAAELTVRHPMGGEEITFSSAPPAWWGPERALLPGPVV